MQNYKTSLVWKNGSAPPQKSFANVRWAEEFLISPTHSNCGELAALGRY